jgi:hypothetical protein
MPSVFTENELVFHDSQDFNYNPFDRYCAAEIEVSKMCTTYDDELVSVANKWSASIVRDGSLPSTGFEINTAPSAGDKYTQQINEICGVLKSGQAFVDKSCGLHVHIDARDFSSSDIAKYAKLWSKIEDTMFRLVPSYRNSHYSKKAASKINVNIEGMTARKATRALADKVYAPNVNIGDYRARSKPSERYYAVNLHSWFHRGTVEIRMHHGTVIASKILNWSILNMAILEASRNISTFNLNTVSFLSGADEQLAFILAVSPSHIRPWIYDTYNFFSRIDGEPVFEATNRHDVAELSET